MALEEYLKSDYLVHCQDMSRLSAAISDAVSLLRLSNTDNGWPYECTSCPSVAAPKTVSHGTTAMVLTAVGRATGFCSTTVRTRTRFIKDKSIKNLFLKNVHTLAVSMKLAADAGSAAPTSSTFGEGNPLTLSHIADLLSSLNPDQALVDLDSRQKGDLLKDLEGIETATEKASRKLDDVISEIERSPQQAQLLERDRSRYYRNAFVPMRAVRAAQSLPKLAKQTALKNRFPLLKNFFEVILHEQLSFSAIPDSRFDAAELVFSLEGLVLCSPEAVDEKLFYRVLEVLGEKQNTSAHWRPSKPFLAAETGEIFLPLSVEVANSLMRSVAIMDHGRFHDTYTSKAAPLLKRFWSWLQARAVRLHIGDEDCLGWHSEHINAPDVVHPWDTSLVVEFMIGYHELLDREIQNTTLMLSGLDWKAPPPAEGSSYSDWSDIVEEMDPSIGGDERTQVYRRIGDDFAKGWKEGKPTNYSMMLYGPPGTGKTSVADKLCQYLGMPRITVTVSDFLGDGGANVESRAKAIFQTLEHQRRAVILFDEIDSFLLDRDSRFYKQQDSLFQFLTPGMLPKFNNLRSAERCIFIVATNYDNRIDPAIKRTGRIDKRYLLPLPDAERRERTLRMFGLTGEFSDELKMVSVLFGFGDLKNIARTEGGDAALIIKSLKTAAKATSFKSYLRRLRSNPEDFPEEEFADLLRLAEDAGGCLEFGKIDHKELELLRKNNPILKAKLDDLRRNTSD